MDNKILQIIPKFRQNARNSLKDISKVTQIPISTIFDKLKLYEGTIIERHVSLLNFEKLGYPTRANILIKENKEKKEELREYIKKHQSVNSAYKINNEYDYLIEVVFKQIKEVDNFLEILENRFKIFEHKIFYVVDDIKREEFLMNEEVNQLTQF